MEIKQLIGGIVFFLMGLLGLVYHKKIIKWKVRLDSEFYGSIFGKKVENSLLKNKKNYGLVSGFVRGIIIFLSLGFLLLSFIIFRKLFT